MKTRRLKIFCFILMAFVATPRAWQQTRSLVETAQSRIEAEWFGLLLSFQTQDARETDAPQTCPQQSAHARTELAARRVSNENKTKRAPASVTTSFASTEELVAQDHSLPDPLAASFDSMTDHQGTDAAHGSAGLNARAFQRVINFNSPDGMNWTTAQMDSKTAMEFEKAVTPLHKLKLPLPPASKRVRSTRASEILELASLPKDAPQAVMDKSIVVRFRTEKGIERFKVFTPKIRSLIGKSVATTFVNINQRERLTAPTPTSVL